MCQGNSAVRPHSLVLIRACRDILPGEELTLSYSSSKQCFRPSDLRYIKCCCGAAACQGTVFTPGRRVVCKPPNTAVVASTPPPNRASSRVLNIPGAPSRVEPGLVPPRSRTPQQEARAECPVPMQLIDHWDCGTPGLSSAAESAQGGDGKGGRVGRRLDATPYQPGPGRDGRAGAPCYPTKATARKRGVGGGDGSKRGRHSHYPQRQPPYAMDNPCEPRQRKVQLLPPKVYPWAGLAHGCTPYFPPSAPPPTTLGPGFEASTATTLPSSASLKVGTATIVGAVGHHGEARQPTTVGWEQQGKRPSSSSLCTVENSMRKEMMTDVMGPAAQTDSEMVTGTEAWHHDDVGHTRHSVASTVVRPSSSMDARSKATSLNGLVKRKRLL